MNLKGIIDTRHDISYFWKVGGGSAFTIILVVSLYAFKHKLRDSFEDMRKNVGESQEKSQRRRRQEYNEVHGAWNV
jgi:hypothetical protein